MKFYVFVPSKHGNVAGFTTDETGGNLPDGFGKWERIEPSSVRDITPTPEQTDQIAKKGYILVETPQSNSRA